MASGRAGVNPCGVMLSFARKIAVFVVGERRGGVKMTGKTDPSHRYTLLAVLFLSASNFVKIFLSRCNHFGVDNLSSLPLTFVKK